MAAQVIAALGSLPALEILGVSVTAPVVSTAMGPFLVDLANTVNASNPNVALTPQEVALAVTRGAMSPAIAGQEAHRSGINDDRFGTLLAITGMPPAPFQMAEALRRGFVSESEYALAVAQSDLKVNKVDGQADYPAVMKKLSTQQASPAEVLTAAVEAQLSPADARAKFTAVGGEPDDYDWRLGTTGSSPSPTELYAMVSRGIISQHGTGLGEKSFDQGIAEGHTRTKWTDDIFALMSPIPAPIRLVAMYHAGGLDEAQLRKYLKMHGTSDELTAAYLTEATHTKVAKAKELAESSVLALYEDQIIDRPTALGLTEALGYNAAQGEYILEIADFRAMAAALKTAVGRVHTLFVAHKIDAAVAQGILGELKVPADRVTALMGVWGTERNANVRILTEAQVVAAWGHTITDTTAAIAGLQALGYDAADAMTLLAIHNKGPLTQAQIDGGFGSA